MEYGGEENNDNEQCEILLLEEKKWDFEYKIYENSKYLNTHFNNKN